MQADAIGNDDVLRHTRDSTRRVLRLLAIAVFGMLSILVFAIVLGASRVAGSELDEALVAAGVFAAIGTPMVAVSLRFFFGWLDRAYSDIDERQRRIDRERQHRVLESQIGDALEMTESEDEALNVIERAFGVVAPTAGTELLLADNSQAHLSRKAVTSPGNGPAGCDVGSPAECPAARRARIHHFPDSESLSACPKLAGRAGGPCSAACIPVSVMGRTVGVIHAVTTADLPLDKRSIQGLQSIANQAGTRIGMLRVMAETQLQAETDALTGLMNRRAFENAFRQVRNRSPHGNGVVVMADLDHFKSINDTHGHDTGDRCLRAFATALRQSVRGADLVARHGGEEFTIAFPDCEPDQAIAVLERIRQQLPAAIRDAGLPKFTASYGVTPAYLSEDLDLLVARADAALFEAKRGGRDRIVTFTASDLDDTAQRELLTETTDVAGTDAPVG